MNTCADCSIDCRRPHRKTSNNYCHGICALHRPVVPVTHTFIFDLHGVYNVSCLRRAKDVNLGVETKIVLTAIDLGINKRCDPLVIIFLILIRMKLPSSPETLMEKDSVTHKLVRAHDRREYTIACTCTG